MPRTPPAQRWIVERPFAHRGLHGADVPENSLPAFEAAVGSDYAIELDVQQLGDGTLVVFHDDGLLRVCGVDEPLSRQTRTSLSARRLFNSSAKVPLLSEVLAAVAGRVPLLIELKRRSDALGMEANVLRELADYRGPFAVQSFNPFAMAWYRRHAPELARGQLAGPLDYPNISRLERILSRRLIALMISRASFVNYELRQLPDAWVNAVIALSGRPLLCWTVRSESERLKAERLDLNYVFENVRP